MPGEVPSGVSAPPLLANTCLALWGRRGGGEGCMGVQGGRTPPSTLYLCVSGPTRPRNPASPPARARRQLVVG